MTPYLLNAMSIVKLSKRFIPRGLPQFHTTGMRPPMQTQQFTEFNDDDDGSEDEEVSVGRTPSPPLKPLSDSVAVPYLDAATGIPLASPPARPPQPPRRIIPQAPEASNDDDDEEEEQDEEFDERLAQSQLFVSTSGTTRIWEFITSTAAILTG